MFSDNTNTLGILYGKIVDVLELGKIDTEYVLANDFDLHELILAIWRLKLLE
jgi:hypothetical protein